MSTNQAQPGRIVNIIAGGAVVSGSVNVVGNYIGVALNSAAVSGEFDVSTASGRGVPA